VLRALKLLVHKSSSNAPRFIGVSVGVTALGNGMQEGESNLTQSAPSPTASANPTPVALATLAPPPDTNLSAKFIVLLYHRFEDRPAELVNHTERFSRSNEGAQDSGVSVISMQIFWLGGMGEKAIPSKSAVITIDDEWNSQYYVDWPIIKEFGYPFTLFIYTQWVNMGGSR